MITTRPRPPSSVTLALTELVGDVDDAGRSWHKATLEGAAEAAIQEENGPPGSAPAHQPVDQRCIDRGRNKEAGPRIGRREEELAAVVLDAVTGEVKDDEVISLARGQERVDPFGDRPTGGVSENLDLEVSDLRIGEDARESLGVLGG